MAGERRARSNERELLRAMRQIRAEIQSRDAQMEDRLRDVLGVELDSRIRKVVQNELANAAAESARTELAKRYAAAHRRAELARTYFRAALGGLLLTAILLPLIVRSVEVPAAGSPTGSFTFDAVATQTDGHQQAVLHSVINMGYDVSTGETVYDMFIPKSSGQIQWSLALWGDAYLKEVSPSAGMKIEDDPDQKEFARQIVSGTTGADPSYALRAANRLTASCAKPAADDPLYSGGTWIEISGVSTMPQQLRPGFLGRWKFIGSWPYRQAVLPAYGELRFDSALYYDKPQPALEPPTFGDTQLTMCSAVTGFTGSFWHGYRTASANPSPSSTSDQAVVWQGQPSSQSVVFEHVYIDAVTTLGVLAVGLAFTLAIGFLPLWISSRAEANPIGDLVWYRIISMMPNELRPRMIRWREKVERQYNIDAEDLLTSSTLMCPTCSRVSMTREVSAQDRCPFCGSRYL